MKVLGIAAAAAIALAPFSAVSTIPVVAHADSFRGVGTDPAGLAAPEHDFGGDANEESTPPWWPSALHYGVFMTAVGFAAWTIGLSLRRSSGMPAIPPHPRPRSGERGAVAVEAALTSPVIDCPGPEVKRRVLVEAAHRCAVPTCGNPTTEIAHIASEAPVRDHSFENLIALCPGCQQKGIDRQSIRTYKRNLGILNSRYSDVERRLFDQIAQSGRRSFVVEAGLEIPLLRAVNDGLLKRVELSAVPTGEATHHRYEVADAGLDFVTRYVQGEDIS
ncbi:HNH endonuclease signature motif containing protein [Mycobacterium sp. 050272]|uniref:HNH endonuclease n=1 Tax=Mycobacterium sp. 050272 TaxID=3142488 RepID=UPI00318D3606